MKLRDSGIGDDPDDAGFFKIVGSQLEVDAVVIRELGLEFGEAFGEVPRNAFSVGEFHVEGIGRDASTDDADGGDGSFGH